VLPCALAFVKVEDFIPNGNATLEDRIVTRFSVYALSPALASAGRNAAAKLVQKAEVAANSAAAAHAKDQPAPSL
jgi:hypothetical protein